MNKLAMEEGYFRNCDTKYQYLWNCKDELMQASRIILATDGDPPGQALAEELARLIGKERCWQVRWSTKGRGDKCKDANEAHGEYFRLRGAEYKSRE
ncbi:TOPRIM domain [Sesbania bispinosa]|nr:TOPRIM domain [Sesbania bispinosa]